MVEGRCEICGKATRKVLLEDTSMKIYICSGKCEQEYFETLRGGDKALQEVLRFLDKKIARMKKYELSCWMVTSLGIVIMLLGIVLINIPPTKEELIGSTLFVAGIAPLTGSLLAISELSRQKQQLVEKRKQLSLAYSY